MPKPTGYDFRTKLSQREGKQIEGTKWLPQDVLYSASQMLSDQPAKTLLVCWYTPDENGRLKLKFQGCQEHDTQMKALAAEMAAFLVAP